MKGIHRYKVLAASAVISVLTCLTVQGQTDVQLTQYWAVPTLYNPAAAGEVDFLRIRGGARMQWVGIENAPMSFLGTADMPFKIGKKKLGVGVNLSQESLGLFSNLAINLQLNYKIRLFKGELSIGVQGGYFNQKFRGSKIITPDNDDYHQSTDEALPDKDLIGNAIDLGAGIRYTHKYFHIGVSGLHLLQPSVNLKMEGTSNTGTQEYYTELPRVVYLEAGCNIPVKNTLLELQPTLKGGTDFNSFTAEVTARCRYNKFLSFGVGYRWKDAVSAMIGVDIKNFFLGYAYDYPLSAISKASSGSHEIVAGYQVKLDFSGKNKNKHKSIRIM